MACSAGVFFGRANVFARESNICWIFRIFILSPIFLCHKIKDGGFQEKNMNKVSPTQNTPALQPLSFQMKNYIYMYDPRQKTSA